MFIIFLDGLQLIILLIIYSCQSYCSLYSCIGFLKSTIILDLKIIQVYWVVFLNIFNFKTNLVESINLALTFLTEYTNLMVVHKHIKSYSINK